MKPSTVGRKRLSGCSARLELGFEPDIVEMEDAASVSIYSDGWPTSGMCLSVCVVIEVTVFPVRSVAVRILDSEISRLEA